MSDYSMPSVNLLAFVEYATGITAAGKLVPDAWQDFPPSTSTPPGGSRAVRKDLPRAKARKITRARKRSGGSIGNDLTAKRRRK